MIVNSHSGRARSSGCSASAPQRSSSARSSPGDGTATHAHVRVEVERRVVGELGRHDAQRRADRRAGRAAGSRRARAAASRAGARRSGRRSRMVRLQKSERSAGSFSTAHMIASAFDIRTRERYAVHGRRQSVQPSGSLPRDGGVLELVEVGPLEQVEHAVDVVGVAAVHQPHEHGLVADDERRDAEDRSGSSPRRCGSARASSAAGRSRPRRRWPRGRGRPTSRSRRAPRPWRSSRRARGGRRTRRGASRGTCRGTRRARRCPRAATFTPVPHSAGSRSQTGGSPSSTWTWSSENGRKVTSQSRPARSPATTESWPLRAKGQR